MGAQVGRIEGGRKLQQRAVLKHVAGDDRRRELREVIPGRGRAARQADLADEVGLGRIAAEVAGKLAALKVTAGLCLSDRVDAGLEIFEAIAAVRRGGRSRDEIAVPVEQLQRHTRKPEFSWVGAPVAILIGEYAARNPGGWDVPKVVIGGELAG